ncbi:uncharacterized protein LOC130139001 [Syzygium oleosum]|uniref:uncharacterized protein LOC130139001 n=1 Tax=Syzygium oleosum TaxID=219896 RepID=UPI0024B94489|nr:uncharacterized protein LOC130139001 [Syzygium oleosum]
MFALLSSLRGFLLLDLVGLLLQIYKCLVWNGCRGTQQNHLSGTAEKKVHRYLIFKIDEKKKEVVVEKTGGAAERYEDCTSSLPENDCRYAVYDFDFVTSAKCQKSKIFFIAWWFQLYCLLILLCMDVGMHGSPLKRMFLCFESRLQFLCIGVM